MLPSMLPSTLPWMLPSVLSSVLPAPLARPPPRPPPPPSLAPRLRFPSSSRTSRTPSSPRLWRRSSCHFREPPRRRARPSRTSFARASTAARAARRATRWRRGSITISGRRVDHHRTGPGGRGDQLRRRGIAQSGRRWDRRGGGHVNGGGRDGEETQTREPIGRGGREPPRGGERVEGDAANLDSFVPVVPPTRVRRRRAGSVQTGHTRSRRAGDGASGGLGDDRGGDEVPSGGGVHGEDPLDSRREGMRANGGMTSTHTTREEGCGARRDDEREGREGRIGGTREWSERLRFARRREGRKVTRVRTRVSQHVV